MRCTATDSFTTAHNTNKSFYYNTLITSDDSLSASCRHHRRPPLGVAPMRELQQQNKPHWSLPQQDASTTGSVLLARTRGMSACITGLGVTHISFLGMERHLVDQCYVPLFHGHPFACGHLQDLGVGLTNQQVAFQTTPCASPNL